MKELIIDRATWTNGRYNTRKLVEQMGFSYLLNAKGNRCCLGFLGQACGVEDGVMNGMGLPSAAGDRSSWPSNMFKKHGLLTFSAEAISAEVSWQWILSGINDIAGVDDSVREEWLIEGFKIGLDYELKFVEEYPAI